MIHVRVIAYSILVKQDNISKPSSRDPVNNITAMTSPLADVMSDSHRSRFTRRPWTTLVVIKISSGSLLVSVLYAERVGPKSQVDNEPIRPVSPAMSAR